MPRKKKSEELSQVSEMEPVVVKEEKCGHINRHAFGVDGKPLPLACDLPKGHQGNHHAHYKKNQPEYVYGEKGRVVKVIQNVVDGETFWQNGAGVPVSEIKGAEAEQLTQYQLDIVADVMKKNPSLKPEQALAAAKLEKAWR